MTPTKPSKPKADLVERLRTDCDNIDALLNEAADEITRLRNTELKMASKLIHLRMALEEASARKTK